MFPALLSSPTGLAPLLLGLLGSLVGCSGEEPGSQAQGTAVESPYPVYLATRDPGRDFGQVWEGAVLEHEFALKVMGTDDLVIESVSADCGCTVPSLEVADAEDGRRRAYENGTALGTGTWLFLQVSYDTRGKVGSAPRSVHILGNLPGGQTKVLLKADVKSWLSARPPRVDLPDLFAADHTATSFEVESPDGTPFLLRHTELGVPPQVGVELLPRDPDGDGRAAAWDVQVTLGPGLPLGTHGYPIQLVSDVRNPDARTAEDGSQPFFAAMPFVGIRVVGLVSVTPGRLTFGMIPSGETISRTLRITSNDPEFVLPEPEARLQPMRTGDDFPLANTAKITTRAVEGENAWDVQLLFSGLDPAVTRTFLARLVVRTGHPEEPSVQVPVTGFHLKSEGQESGQ